MVIEKSDSKKFILCTLSKTVQLQQPLNVILNAGESVTFYTNAKNGVINLTGYYMLENEFDNYNDDMGGHNCATDHDLPVPFGNEFDEDDDDDDDDDDDEDDEDDDDDDDDDDENGYADLNDSKLNYYTI